MGQMTNSDEGQLLEINILWQSRKLVWSSDGRCYYRSKALAKSCRYWVRVHELNSRRRSWRRAQSEEVWKNLVHLWNVGSSLACLLEHGECSWDAAGENLSGKSQLVTPINLCHHKFVPSLITHINDPVFLSQGLPRIKDPLWDISFF